MINLLNVLAEKLPNSKYQFKEEIQSLWSGYGSIERWEDSNGDSIVIKHIKYPETNNHPRGWNSKLGHLRKVKSYEVENAWYKKYASKSKARLPRLLFNAEIEDTQVIVLEDLDKSGFNKRAYDLTNNQFNSCVSWLAEFHACFMNDSGEGLWEIGTYWHLETRPDELKEMAEGELKEHASEIDKVLKNCKYKTIVHGDAKAANFCFSEESEVAAVDFQYVGLGCGMKDLIYFISSVEEINNVEREKEVLDFYFDELAKFLGERNLDLENEWRKLYKYAWADFNRFLQGWSPGHWKLNNYVDEITAEAIQEIKRQHCLDVIKKSVVEAGEYIQKKVGSKLNINSKGDSLSLASSVVTEVDFEVQELVFKSVKILIDKYNLGVLSEELTDSGGRFKNDYFICIDPLDGTLPFTEQVEGYSVAIALVSKFGEPVLGVIYNPFRNDLYEAVKGGGVKKNGMPFKVKYSNSKFTFITDRSFTKSIDYDSFIQSLKTDAKQKGLNEFEIIAKGGASMNAMWVLENAPASYIKPPKENLGGGGIWDFAASACIFKELGLRATNYEGGRLDLNRKDSTFMNHEGVWFEA